MKTADQIEGEAQAIAYNHFYCESGEPWEPFAHYSEEQLAEETASLAGVIAHAMRWAQE